MPRINRKTTPKVRDGRVRKKNRTRETPNHMNTPHRWPAIDRRRPGATYRHVILKRDVETFLELLPNWDELSTGLKAIVLAAGSYNVFGWHEPGVVGLCAWDAKLWIQHRISFYEEHRRILGRLGVPTRKFRGNDGTYVECRYTEVTAKAFLLLHVLPHELGHHHDRMTTRSKIDSARGEGYAEAYALRYFDVIFDRYCGTFGFCP